MGHSDLIDFLLNINAAVLLASLSVFYAYSDRTDGFTASLKGTKDVLTELRRRISKELEDKLRPIFESPGSVPSPVLGQGGDTYFEHPVNPVGSEIYREHIRDFLEEQTVAVCDYHALSFACRQWCFWAGILRMILVGLFSWQLVVCVLLSIDKASKLDCPNWLLCTGSVLTGVFIVGLIVTVVFRLHHYRTITKLRLKYGEL